MQILLGIIVAAIVGVALHFALPQRVTRGALLAPGIATATGAVVWTALTWAGFAVDNPWLWVAALVVPAVVTAPIVSLVGASRARRDATERRRLHVT